MGVGENSYVHTYFSSIYNFSTPRISNLFTALEMHMKVLANSD